MSRRSWWSGLGLRVTIGLTMIVAILSVVTGIARISQQTVAGPLATVIPPGVQALVGFTGVLTGFLMMGSVLGLRRGFRFAWWSTAVLLPVTALQGLLQSSPFSLPLVIVSALALPNLLAHRRRFTRSLDLTEAQVVAISAIVGAQVYGTVGAFALREEFANVSTLVDAFYFTLITASTVGYGDVTPAPQSQVAKLFVMSVVIVGTASFAIALGTLFGPAIEARFERALGRMTESQLELLDDHLLILGHGDLTDVILEELGESVEFLVITADADWAASMNDRGIEVFVADPSDESALRRAQIEDAAGVLVATNNDADDALAVLTARQLNPSVTIVAAATNRENVEKLRRAGADTVISPATIGGHLLVESVLGREGVEEVARTMTGDHDDVTDDAPAPGTD